MGSGRVGWSPNGRKREVKLVGRSALAECVIAGILVSNMEKVRCAHRHELTDAYQTVIIQPIGAIDFECIAVTGVVAGLRGLHFDNSVLDAVYGAVHGGRHDSATDKHCQQQRGDRSIDVAYESMHGGIRHGWLAYRGGLGVVPP